MLPAHFRRNLYAPCETVPTTQGVPRSSAKTSTLSCGVQLRVPRAYFTLLSAETSQAGHVLSGDNTQQCWCSCAGAECRQERVMSGRRFPRTAAWTSEQKAPRSPQSFPSSHRVEVQATMPTVIVTDVDEQPQAAATAVQPSKRKQPPDADRRGNRTEKTVKKKEKRPRSSDEPAASEEKLKRAQVAKPPRDPQQRMRKQRAVEDDLEARLRAFTLDLPGVLGKKSIFLTPDSRLTCRTLTRSRSRRSRRNPRRVLRMTRRRQTSHSSTPKHKHGECGGQPVVASRPGKGSTRAARARFRFKKGCSTTEAVLGLVRVGRHQHRRLFRRLSLAVGSEGFSGRPTLACLAARSSSRKLLRRRTSSSCPRGLLLRCVPLVAHLVQALFHSSQ